MEVQRDHVAANLPNSTDEVPTRYREFFAWTIREGITNVLRHSAASKCTVTLDAQSVEVVDDGRGLIAKGEGSGLAGLRERAESVGARLTTESLDGGFRLRIEAT